MSGSYGWTILIGIIGLSGAAMLLFAKPFEGYSHRPDALNRGGPHSVRFYRVMGAIWLVIAALIALPLIAFR
jgi:hypothetical protein